MTPSQHTEVFITGRVSPHLTWSEATTTESRDVEILKDQANLPALIKSNIVWFASEIFEPARLITGPLHVNSLYRCPRLNTVIGGASTSMHMQGLAADVFPLIQDMHLAFLRLQNNHLLYDQLIWEFGRWIHIGGPKAGSIPRQQTLMIFETGKYLSFNENDVRFNRS